MTDAQLKHLHARISKRVKAKAAIDIADIKAAVPFRIEEELIETLNLEDAVTDDERNLKRIRRLISATQNAQTP